MEGTQIRKQNKIEDSLAVWQEFNELGRKYGLISLGVGAPYLNPPKFLVENLLKTIEDGYNQYTSSYGHPEARKYIAEFYQDKFDHQIDPVKEVMITNGANSGLNVLFTALLADKNDEIIFIEPFFSPYHNHAQMAWGTVKTVPLILTEDQKWYLDLDKLKETLNSKTRCIVLNTPHNPTGKVFSLKELEEISDILEDYPHVYVISDEVYDFLTFDGLKHYIFANIKDNWKKTVTVFSGGKLMWATGWKVGWSIGPADILRQAVVINDTCIYCFNVPGQIAIARSLRQAFEEQYEGFRNFIEYQIDDFKNTHDLLVKGLKEWDLPIEPIPAEGGYFIMADVSGLKDIVPEKYFLQNEYEDDQNTTIEKNDIGIPVPLDLAVSRWLAIEKNVITMPWNYFNSKDSLNKSDNYIRFAFWRGEEATRKAIQYLNAKLD